MSPEGRGPVIGVLALQGAFEEHQECLEAIGCQTKQIRTAEELEGVDGIVLPGGESTAMGLIAANSNLWTELQSFSKTKPIWGTCAGMILLSDKCIGGSAVIENGQTLIGGMDILVCRNYFGSQISSFEMPTPAPPTSDTNETPENTTPYPGVFIRAPAILTSSSDVTVLGKVMATPCCQAAVVLRELETKIAAGENVVQMPVVDALERKKGEGIFYKEVKKGMDGTIDHSLKLPGASDGSNAREVICAARKGNILCTAFHPELTKDYRWHQYFLDMVTASQ